MQPELYLTLIMMAVMTVLLDLSYLLVTILYLSMDTMTLLHLKGLKKCFQQQKNQHL